MIKNKIIRILLVSGIAISLVSCGESNVNQETDSNVNSEIESNNNVDENTVSPENKEEVDSNEDELESNSESDNIVGRIYYKEGFTGDYFYLEKEVSSNNIDMVNDILKSLNSLPGTDYLEDVEHQEFSSLTSTISANKVTVDGDVAYIDLNKNFTEGLGSYDELIVTDSLVKSIGFNLDVSEVLITFNGKNYSSGHVLKEDGETFAVSSSTGTKLKNSKS